MTQGALSLQFQRPSDQSILWIDRAVAPLGQLCLVAGPLQVCPPMFIEAATLPLNISGSCQAELDAGGRQHPQYLLTDAATTASSGASG
jgi:hypothetical protein